MEIRGHAALVTGAASGMGAATARYLAAAAGHDDHIDGTPAVVARGVWSGMSPHGRPIPPPSAGTAAEPPEDATTGRSRIAGLRVVAIRIEGHRVRGWTPEGAEIIDQASAVGAS